MTDYQEHSDRKEMEKLVNELTYQRYLMNEGQIRNFFKKMSIPEYIALHIIASDLEEEEICSGKTYLKNLAGKMRLTIQQISKMVEKLADQGLVLWQHDGDGREGTYVTITETGKKLLCEQQTVLKEYYGNVMKKFGKENLYRLLELMKQLENVMSDEFMSMEEK